MAYHFPIRFTRKNNFSGNASGRPGNEAKQLAPMIINNHFIHSLKAAMPQGF